MYVSNTMQKSYLSMQKINNNEIKNASSSLLTTGENGGMKRLDFTNMSRSNMRETVNNLIKSGQMNLDESSSLLGLMSNTPLDRANANTQNRDTQPIDFIATLKHNISYNQSIGNEEGVKYGNLSLNALEKLQNTSSGINIKV